MKPKKRKRSSNSNSRSIHIVIRYLILLGLIFTLPLIYKILTPITINLTSSLLNLFYKISVNNDIIIINSQTFIQIIPACVAGSAYLLLIILNLSVPMKTKKRLQSISLGIIIFFLANIIRITILASWYHNELPFFDFTHSLTWYAGSTILILAIWFLLVKIFSIKEIPLYTDLKFLVRNIKK